ncbi:MAG: substrate-binding domain-containing protein [Planctomycetes bacterium]|nr:substrate-binding domain-containing protein [Planctomycetota bacterium]
MPGYVQGICRAAHEAAVDVHVALIPATQAEMITASNLAAHVPVMQNTSLDGVILIYAWPLSAIEIISRRCPCVSIVHQTYLPKIDHLMLGTEDAVRRLVIHLWSEAHRHNIGFFGACNGLTWSRQALLYFRQEMDQRLAPLQPSQIIPAAEEALLGMSSEWSESVAAAIESTRAGTTAWLCPNGVSASALMAGLAESRLDVPGSVSVAAVDAGDRPGSGITTVQFNTHNTGATALSLLCERISHPRAEGRTILIPARNVIIGKTTMPGR